MLKLTLQKSSDFSSGFRLLASLFGPYWHSKTFRPQIRKGTPSNGTIGLAVLCQSSRGDFTFPEIKYGDKKFSRFILIKTALKDVTKCQLLILYYSIQYTVQLEIIVFPSFTPQ